MQTVSSFNEIVINSIPMIDVRAPIEFERGTLLGAVNLPLMNDQERHEVGLCYKEKGKGAAIALGHELVSGELKDKRIQAWRDFAQKQGNAILYCSRGGMRSQISQKWLYEVAGIAIPRVEGGYKAFRNYLLAELEPERITSQPIILGGRTGAGKTILLKKLDNSIDLEGLAHHRGSSFGRHIEGQPGQATFENRLAWALIHHRHAKHKAMVLEAEGANVGRCFLPKPLVAHFGESPYVVLEASVEERTQTTYAEYVLHEQQDYLHHFGVEQGLDRWLQAMQESVDRIQNRLGLERAKNIKTMQLKAHEQQRKTGSAQGHEAWIAFLLTDYYDPLYDYSIKKNSRKCIFSGNASEMLDFLRVYPG